MKVQCAFINFENENLGDMNDLYNTQKVILLCKTIENRF